MNKNSQNSSLLLLEINYFLASYKHKIFIVTIILLILIILLSLYYIPLSIKIYTNSFYS